MENPINFPEYQDAIEKLKDIYKGDPVIDSYAKGTHICHIAADIVANVIDLHAKKLFMQATARHGIPTKEEAVEIVSLWGWLSKEIAVYITENGGLPYISRLKWVAMVLLNVAPPLRAIIVHAEMEIEDSTPDEGVILDKLVALFNRMETPEVQAKWSIAKAAGQSLNNLN